MLRLSPDRSAPTSDDAFVQAQRDLAEEWGFRSFNEALRSWIATVALVEIGYEGEWEEYANELTARDYLDELRRRSGSDWPPRLDKELAPWDERFRAATVEIAEPQGAPQVEVGIRRSAESWAHPRVAEIAASDDDVKGVL